MGLLGYLLHRLILEDQIHLLGLHQPRLLRDQVVLRLPQDTEKLFFAQGGEADSDGEAAQKLRDEIIDFRHGEGATRDEEDMVCFDISELSIDGCSFDEREEISLHSFC